MISHQMRKVKTATHGNDGLLDRYEQDEAWTVALVLVLGRCEQDKLYTLVAINVCIMAWWDLEEVSCYDHRALSAT